MKTGTIVFLPAIITVSELDVSVSPIQTLFDREPVFGYIVKGLLGDWHRDC
jgi:hypothetical protein